MKIGYGVLLPVGPFNAVRELEVKLRNVCKSEAGLFQDPHVTIKRPFTIDRQSLPVFLRYMKILSRKVKPFEISLQGIGFFGTSTIYLNVKPSRKLNDLHRMIVNDLRSRGIEASTFDSPHMVFHSTLAMDLTEQQFKKASGIISAMQEIKLTFTCTEIGIFLNIEGSDAWVVLRKQKIG